jgi:hypothetical protein
MCVGHLARQRASTYKLFFCVALVNDDDGSAPARRSLVYW